MTGEGYKKRELCAVVYGIRIQQIEQSKIIIIERP